MRILLIAAVFASRLYAQEPTSTPASLPASAPASVPASAPVTQAITPLPIVAPAPKPLLPAALAIVNGGRLSVRMLLQARYETNSAAEDLLVSPSTFRIKRARLRLSGDMIPEKLSFTVMTDFAKALFTPEVDETGATQIVPDNLLNIRDAYLVFKHPYGNLRVGQFKSIISLEGTESISSLILPERALVSGAFGGKRDMGARLERERDLYSAYIALTNGSGENRLDNDNAKELSGRFMFTPSYDGSYFTLALVGQQTIGESAASKQIVEGDLRVERGPFLAQAEMIYLRKEAADSFTETVGWYVQPSYIYRRRLQLSARVGALNKDISTRDLLEEELWLGLNYFLIQDRAKADARLSVHPEYHQAKLSLSYAYFRGQLSDAQDLTLGVQISF